ncbi:MAG: hypothetical protein D6693_04065 [Planctomycetota bacterium]|nr:MAG: hypothetical protein D6693_04065 [Planctomycetota bacterium]
MIDDTMASALRGEDGETALARHQRTARAVLDTLGAGDRAAVVTLSSPARGVVAPASADLAGVASVIESLAPTDARADWDGALAAVGRAIEDQTDARGTRTVIALSDFRAGSADLTRALPAALEGSARTRLAASAPAQAPAPNVQIVAVEPLRRLALARDESGSMDVRVRLRRTGSATAQRGVTSVRAALARSLAPTVEGASAAVRWRPGQAEAETVVSLETASMESDGAAALVAWIDRDGLDRDDRRARPVVVRRAIRVGVADRPRFGPLPGADELTPADWLRLALAPTEAVPVEVTDVDPAALDAPTLARLDALFVPRPDLIVEEGWRRVGAFARAGGVVVVTPPPGLTVHLWSDAMTRALGLRWRLAREASSADQAQSVAGASDRAGLFELLAGELPALARSVSVQRVLPVVDGASSSTAALSLTDGTPWLILSAPGPEAGAGQTEGEAPAPTRGLVAYLASAPALTWTNLPARPLFVALVQELVRQGVGEAVGGGAFIAGSRPVAPPRSTELVELDTGARIGVGPTNLASAPVRRAGLYRAVDPAGLERGLIAVNPDERAGLTEVQPADAVRSWLAGAGVEPGSVEWLAPAGAGVAGAAADEEGSALAWWLLLAAAGVALAETVMARLFSHASVAPAGAGAAA